VRARGIRHRKQDGYSCAAAIRGQTRGGAGYEMYLEDGWQPPDRRIVAATRQTRCRGSWQSTGTQSKDPCARKSCYARASASTRTCTYLQENNKTKQSIIQHARARAFGDDDRATSVPDWWQDIWIPGGPILQFFDPRQHLQCHGRVQNDKHTGQHSFQPLS
jgi:hypothetical protein